MKEPLVTVAVIAYKSADFIIEIKNWSIILLQLNKMFETIMHFLSTKPS